MSPLDRYRQTQKQIAAHANTCGRSSKEITLLPVTKTVSWETAEPLFQAGCREFGESRVQEALRKKLEAPQEALWHLIGPLQKNKVVKAVEAFCLIHSVDSFELGKHIAEVSEAKGVVTPILLQVNCSQEAAKQGLHPDSCEGILSALLPYTNLAIAGWMTIAPLTKDEGCIRSCFSQLREIRDRFVFLASEKDSLYHLSMGMSNDWKIAIEEGSTILRVGRALWHLPHEKSATAAHS